MTMVDYRLKRLGVLFMMKMLIFTGATLSSSRKVMTRASFVSLFPNSGRRGSSSKVSTTSTNFMKYISRTTSWGKIGGSLCDNSLKRTRNPHDNISTRLYATTKEQNLEKNKSTATAIPTGTSIKKQDISTTAETAKLYVGNITQATTVDSISQCVQSQLNDDDNDDDPIIKIMEISISKDYKTGLSRGYAFVTVRIKPMDGSIHLSSHKNDNSISLQRFIDKMNGIELDGKNLVVNQYFPRGRYSTEKQISETSSPPSTTRKTQYTIDDTVCPPTDEETLQKIVFKHTRTSEKYISSKPFAMHTVQAFKEVESFINEMQGKMKDNGIILDSGCGTGRSTIILGERNPNSVVIGVDRSLSRLQQNSFYRNKDEQAMEEENEGENKDNDNDDSSDVLLTRRVPGLPNVILVRAELTDFWRLCCTKLKEKNNGWDIKEHYLLYPNPYPKKSRVKSRWYAHPSFPILLQVGGRLIIRSNWKRYLEEFSLSVNFCDKYLSDSESGTDMANYASRYAIPNDSVDGNCAFGVNELDRNDNSFIPMTNFEKKYFVCGEPMYELIMNDADK